MYAVNPKENVNDAVGIMVIGADFNVVIITVAG